MSLRGIPVIVLSDNDGCAVARSDDYVELRDSSIKSAFAAAIIGED